MRVLLDTNVVIDILLRRSPWATEAGEIDRACLDGRLTGYLGASAWTDIFYITRRLVGRDEARRLARMCLDGFEILPVDADALEAAYALPIADIEDALQAALVLRNRLDAIVTRDARGFAGAGVSALTPADLIERLRAG